MWENDVESASSSLENGSVGTSTKYVPAATVSAASAELLDRAGDPTNQEPGHKSGCEQRDGHGDGDRDREGGGERLFGMVCDVRGVDPSAGEVLVEQPRCDQGRG